MRMLSRTLPASGPRSARAFSVTCAMTSRMTFVAVTLSVLCALTAAGCASGPRAAVKPAGPDQHQAQAVADREFGLLAGGGWGAAWDLWTASAQHVISRTDFVRVGTECAPWLGQPFVVKEMRWPATGQFTVTWQRAGVSATSSVLYQNGAWRFQPDPASLATFGAGGAAVLSRLRGQHACRP